MRALAGSLLLLGVFPLANLLTNGRAVPWFGGAAREWATRGILLALVAGFVSWRFGPFVDAILARGRAWLLKPWQSAFDMGAAIAAALAAAAVSRIAFAG